MVLFRYSIQHYRIYFRGYHGRFHSFLVAGSVAGAPVGNELSLSAVGWFICLILPYISNETGAFAWCSKYAIPDCRRLSKARTALLIDRQCQHHEGLVPK